MTEFMPHRNGDKARLDMINFVADNKERYLWDCHVVLKMYETNLNAWGCRMTYWENGADELALYALSDLTKQHTVVITCTKPWSTIHPDVKISDIYQLLDMCSVKLLYLGTQKFGRLRPHPSNYEAPIMVNLPVFPGIEPQTTHESPSEWEIETAYSLLSVNPADNSEALRLQEPSVEPHTSQQPETTSELPDLTNKLGPPDQTKFVDAMEHVIGYSLPSLNYVFKNQSDAMLSLCENSVLVETSPDKEPPAYALVTPLVEKQLKNCSIKLTLIDEVLSYVPKQNLCNALMHAGKPHTRSACTPKPPTAPTRRGRSQYARSVRSVSVNYKDPDTMSDEDSARKNQKPSTRSSVKPKATGPTDERIHSQNNKTVHPTQ